MKNLIKIENDCCFICERIKEIDPSYEIYFNLESNSYEVHSSQQVKNSYCFKVPYSQLDSRAIDFAFKTRVQNIEKILAQIDKDNQILYEKEVKKQVNMLKEALCW